ncbi:unnamed protein product [Penicillium salamii]|uniref:Fungal N-terminal domain-containing protein n=1 Tax=Penicillium salamii TaxID=1612424 RepID=A0A9W4NU07_9EURO|nr:unnamed protein product [Penicillium salamii]CAG8201625.1 unnamed protein product [Penicillium salamii]CAG8270462.1 unnamed protein product [Penicillium salamii]CAG8303618.1 unnamed protein product [Penicillium salamii]CAG8361079.1 unnamed protein product [Penicillium salamii]
MSFGLSIGDIMLCSQIAHRLFVAATSGRKDAPRKLREFEHILFGLNFSLDHLQEACNAVLSRPNTDASRLHTQLRIMLLSCRQTLEELESATAPYREAVDDPISTSIDPSNLRKSTHGIITHVKFQWRRFLWDFQGESLSQYRYRLQSHTDSINLILGSLILSATDRIEENGRHRSERMEGMLRQASHFNSALFHLIQGSHHPPKPGRSSTLPDMSYSTVSQSGFVPPLYERV